MTYLNTREEELKNKITQDYFWLYDCSKIMGNVDFCVCMHGSGAIFEQESLLWAEAKKGSSDVHKSIVQLILTIGKARTFDKFLPPAFLGAFDAEKIAFVPYSQVHDVFYQNDFNWNVAPSNHDTKEFRLIYDKVKASFDSQALIFDYQKDGKELKAFIKTNFVVGKFGLTKTKIDKNNFMVIYNKWLKEVKPTIIMNWDFAKSKGLIDADFYLADLLSHENETLKEKLFVLLRKDIYELERKLNDYGMFDITYTKFTDKQKAHTQFWNRYDRPPQEEYWDYIVERRDLLVPQDVRERKGSFFTPQIWVELSQQYLADVLGNDWQDDYYIWDCAAGTGNLLAGLTNKRHIFASTLDKQDVFVMYDRIENGANFIKEHVFQFDFLNDDFTKLPQNLQEIINDPEKRKKLVVYINPPYAEASNKKTLKGVEGNRGVEQNNTNKKYAAQLGQGNVELSVQFLTRIYCEIPDCTIAEFSKLKIISGPHFIDFRKFFKAKMLKSFVCPADTFDNVKGQFSIGFMIWDTNDKQKIEQIEADVYDKTGKKIQIREYYSYDGNKYMNDWVKPYRADLAKNQLIGKFPFKGNDFQNQDMVQIMHHKMDYNTAAGQFLVNQKNIGIACVYFAVRKCISANWLNDNDQFLYPNKEWEVDLEFQSDCLAYTLFNNKMQSKYGTNHWIPFTENEVNPSGMFESNFMTNYIAGKVNKEISYDLFEKLEKKEHKPIKFSFEASELFDAGRKLWKYYHKTLNDRPEWAMLGGYNFPALSPDKGVNASLYDIREYFQGRSETGKMNNKSEDETYTNLIADLRNKLKIVAEKIEPKVYQYGFLK